MKKLNEIEFVVICILLFTSAYVVGDALFYTLLYMTEGLR